MRSPVDRTGAIVLAAGLAIIGLTGWLLATSLGERRVPIVAEGAAKRLPTPKEVDAEALGKLAAESCVCERAAAGRDCWAEYRKRIANFEVESIAAACLPLSIENDCVMTTEGEVCWLSSYGMPGVCSDDEAAAVEHAFNTAPPGKEYEAMEAVVARIRRGEKISLQERQGGCA